MSTTLNSVKAAAAAAPYIPPPATEAAPKSAAAPQMSTSPSGHSQAAEAVKQKAKQAEVSKEEWEQFTTFYLQFGKQLGTSQFDANAWIKHLPTHFATYNTLFNRPKDERLAKHFAESCWNLGTVFLHLVETHLQAQQGLLSDQTDYVKRRHCYRSTIHPHFLTFQKMTNFLATCIPKTKLDETIYSIEIDQQRRLALVPDTLGYIPVPYLHTTKETQLVLIHWGDRILNPPEGHHELLLFFDCGRLEPRDGFVVDLTRQPLTNCPVMTLYGVHDQWKSLLTVVAHPASPDPLVRKFAKYFVEDIKSFTIRTAIDHDVFFVPLPPTPQEEREFAYLLLDAMKENKEPVDETILSELEREMRAKIEAEQQARQAAVVAGTTQGARGGKRGKGGKKAAPKPPTSKQPSREDLVDQAFKQWKVEGRIKYQRLLHIARQILKENPEVLQSVTQNGSHLSLHTAAGVATVARRDEVSQTSANNFIREVLRAVNRELL
ncbi:MAG: hypothetical protein KDK65_05900 [Chlamydiia bacterium]|nr:hypothetical protein [Chlamydiia bacterium]